MLIIKKISPNFKDQNNDRSAIADQVITLFMRITGSEREDAASDLMADIGHWCTHNYMNYEKELLRAKAHYYAELTGE